MLKDLLDKLMKLRSDREKFTKFIVIILVALYFFGMLINSVKNGINNTFEHTNLSLIIMNPFKNLVAIFSKTGLAIIAFVAIMYCLFTKKGYTLVSGYKTTFDKERGLEILPDGTHGTSSWLSTKEVAKDLTSVFSTGKIVDTKTTLLGKLDNTSNVKEKQDFWEKSEKNLLMALLHYVLTMTDDFGQILPIEQRSIGTIYRMLSTHNIAAFDKSSMFSSLLFMRLSDYARKFGNNRKLPVTVNVMLEEFANIGKLLDFKKVLSTARSRGINIQIIIQSIAQLADRYPEPEWQEIVGNCDCQLFLGCNDQMTAEFLSKQCGIMTIRLNNSNVPMTPLFSPVLHTTKPYTHNKTSTGRALMLPDEIRRLPFDESIVLVRGQKPLKLKKIIPNEHHAFCKLSYTKVTEYIPKWRELPDIENVVETNQYTKDFKVAKKQIDNSSKTKVTIQDTAETQLLERVDRIGNYYEEVDL